MDLGWTSLRLPLHCCGQAASQAAAGYGNQSVLGLQGGSKCSLELPWLD